MVVSVILLIVGFALLVKGADFFVSGSSRIAKALKIPPLVIGLTLVSMGTSAPEASVSINGVVSGMNDMSLGNVVGSNIFNTLFILGVSALIVPLQIGKDVKRFDIPVMVGIYSLLILFSFVITPYSIDLFEGIIMLTLFIGYMVFLVLRAKRESKTLKDEPTSENVKDKPLWLSILLAVIGLAAVIFGGKLSVDNAAKIAAALGMSENLVGLTIVAVGTSLPELVTSVVASVKKEGDIAIGNVVGSNIFNIVFILGITSTIKPLQLNISALTDLLVMLGSGVLILTVSLLSKKTKRWQGAVMAACYVGYLAYIIIRN